MPKQKNLVPTRLLNVALPLPVYTQLLLHLNSDLEGRVPHGAWSRFLSELIKAHFEESTLDLAPFAGPEIPAGIYTVRGAPETLRILERKLS